MSFLGLIDTGVLDASVGASPLESKAVRLSHKVRGVEGFQDLFVRGLRFIRSAVYLRLYELWLRLGRSIPYEHRPTSYDLLCARAYRDYLLKPYSGHITMFSSAGNSERQRAYWGPLARGGLKILEMPAGHDDMVLPPHSKLLAEHFDACLGATALHG